MIIRLGQSGSVGVISDLSQPELPPSAWTDANNIRFIDGYAAQTFGYSEVYASPSYVPLHVVPVRDNSGNKVWVVASAGKIHTVTGGVYTDRTKAATTYGGLQNTWTSCLLSGVPILNEGTMNPQYWDLTAATFVDLTNWYTGTAKAVRSYKNFLVALGVTKSGTYKPHMVKWSHPADPGSVPSSWNEADATKDAGETDVASDIGGVVVDGIQVRDSFLVFKQSATYRMTFTGGTYVMRFDQISASSGILNKNCAVEQDGLAYVISNGDIVIHDGVNPPVSILDKQTRRTFFARIESTSIDKVFAFKNPHMREILFAYPSYGSTTCDKALVFNYKDKTVSWRDLPNVNHANIGIMEGSTSGTWSSDTEPWAADTTTWGQTDFTPDTLRCMLASNDQKLFLLDSSALANGVAISSYLERTGLHFGEPESIKLIKSVRPRIVGTNGETVNISVGWSDDPYASPTYTTVAHTIGTTVSDDLLVSGRYLALKISSGSAYQWRVDSIDLDIDKAGAW